MKHNCRLSSTRVPSEQRGAVLVLSILILLVLTLLGISSMSSSNMQERMAGNARLQAEAFEAASAGVANALDYVSSQFDLLAGDPSALGANIDDQCGALGHAGWIDASGDPVATAYFSNDDSVLESGAAHRLRMYCLVDPDGLQPRSQLFVESNGQKAIGGEMVAQRSIEVRVGLVEDTTISGDGCTALCLPGGDPGTLQFPTSNAFAVDGAGGPAISAGTDALRDAIRDAIRDNRIGNYSGGIETTTIGSPWNSVALVEAFRQWIELGAALESTAYYGNQNISGNPEFGTTGAPQITYFDGDVDFGGTPSGAGIMVVNGNLESGGTPQFDGLLVVLGSYSITGGGTGGGPAGSVVILNPDGASAIDFGNVNGNFTGGGNALYAFDCDNLLLARDTLFRTIDDAAYPVADDVMDADGGGATGETIGQLTGIDADAVADQNLYLDNLWNPSCNTSPDNLVAADRTDLRILSWRENIGWREASDFAGAGL